MREVGEEQALGAGCNEGSAGKCNARRWGKATEQDEEEEVLEVEVEVEVGEQREGGHSRLFSWV